MTNLNYTGSENPYGLIQNAGKRKRYTHKRHTSKRKSHRKKIRGKTRKHRR